VVFAQTVAAIDFTSLYSLGEPSSTRWRVSSAVFAHTLAAIRLYCAVWANLLERGNLSLPVPLTPSILNVKYLQAVGQVTHITTELPGTMDAELSQAVHEPHCLNDVALQVLAVLDSEYF